MARKMTMALCLALFLLAANGGWAQGGAGDLTGVVYDQTGAVVPQAKVTLTNTATGVVRNTETGDAGVYRFVGLPVVGTYKLKVEVSGFKTYEVGNIVVSVARVTTTDVHLEVGAAAATVTVEAGAELVQTRESQLSELVDRRVWESIPLETRNQNTFINLLSGVVPDDFGGTTRGAAVNGMRPGTGNFLVEGFDNNDQGQGGRGARTAAGGITSISPEAIQEYRVVTNGYAAEYGKGGGFINDMVLRSGTNNWHGSLFEYNRVQALAANSFFSNQAGLQDRLVRNQYGGSLGGPIIKDRAFIYGSYEGHLRRASTPATGTVMTQAFLDFVRNGQFRTFIETSPNGICNNATLLANVTSNFGIPTPAAAPCPGAFAGSGNTGPIFNGLLSAAATAFPLASASATGQSSAGRGPWTGLGVVYPVPVYAQASALRSVQFNEHRVSIKSDNHLSSKDQLNYTLLWEDADNFDSLYGGYGTFGVPYSSPGGSVLTGITWTRTFTPTVLNTTKFSYLRHVANFPNTPGFENTPQVITAFDSLASSFGNGSNLPQFFTENLFQLQNHTSVVKGNHTFKVGGEYRRTRNGSSFSAFKNGAFAFHAVEDLLTDGLFSDAADLFLYGAPYYGAIYYAGAAIDPSRCTTPTGGCPEPEYYRGYRANEISWYFQDDWKIHRRLSLNVGLRWEYFGPPHNFRKGLDSNFYFGNSGSLLPAPAPSANPFFPANNPWIAREVSGRFEQRDENIWQKDMNNFAPRFGFAYDVFGNQKWVLRGSYGVYFDRMWNNLFENIRFNAPFHSFSYVFYQPVSTGIYSVPFAQSSRNLFSPGGASPRHMDENLATAYSQQFHLTGQWQFAKDYVVELGYVGTLGNKLTGVLNLNTFNGRTRGGGSARPNGTITNDNFRTTAFRSNYHSFQAVVRKNFSNGLQFNANYTWSHAIDYVSDAFNNGRACATCLRPIDNFNWMLDRGSADFDIRHRVVLSYFYDLPWMKDNRWLGGWSFSGITSLQTGVPMILFDSSSGSDANADGHFTDRPIFNGSGNINNIVNNSVSPADGYVTLASFTRLRSATNCPSGLPNGGRIIGTPATATQWWCNSDLGRGVLRAPGFVNFDFGVHKKFKLTEAIKMTFQANFFNIFNHPNFGVPVGDLNDPTNFGKSTFTIGGAGTGGSGARVTQLALRIDF